MFACSFNNWIVEQVLALINGKGNYYDCEDVYKREVGDQGGGVAATACSFPSTGGL